jgi:electron transfer flavoprotein beta subunit
VTNIVVAVKYVPDATADRKFTSDNTVDREGVDGLLSELDEYAVEQALQAVEAGEGEVTVLTVGPAAAAEAVRKALQMGAHKGVHVVDDAIHGSDVFATAKVLAEAIKKLDHDLVLFGMGSTDGAAGVVPSLVGDLLGLPSVTFGSKFELDGSTVKITRDGDFATIEVEASTPAVVSVTDQTDEARYPSFKGIMAAKKKEVTQWSLSDLGLDAGSVGQEAAWTQVESFEPRPPRTAGEIVTDEGDGGAKLVEFLAAKKFV